MTSKKLENLRQSLAKQGLAGFIVPNTDEYQGEFTPDCAKRLTWLTGFTGSAGTAVILPDRAIILTDGRYTIQVRNETNPNLYETGDSTKIGSGDWLMANGKKGQIIGYDPWLHTAESIAKIQEKLEAAGLILKPVEQNPIDEIWIDRPAAPCTPVILFPDKIAGMTSAEKRTLMAAQLREQGAEALILTLSDSIAWLLNIRGNDVDYAPVALSYAILKADGKLDWFINPKKVPEGVRVQLGQNIHIHEEREIKTHLQNFRNKPIWLDKKSAPQWFTQTLEAVQSIIINIKDPCTWPKAIKTPSEQDAIREAHIRDGVAIVRFLKWFEEEGNKGQTEISIAEKLEQFRARDKNYKGPSFATIAGFGPNGAIIHYRATEKTNRKLEPNNLLLLDSGGQYTYGTTDVTRTLAVGTPAWEMKENFTRVLKGHIAIASAIFSRGTLGKEIDVFARKSLQEVGLDYAHGTGHGVGCYLGVHEDAANISPRGDKPLEPEMLLSNEPGYYKEDAYGIRIENLILVKEQEGNRDKLYFETVTMVPFDKSLIVQEMLNNTEKNWLENYNKIIWEKLSPHLDTTEQHWLKSKIEI